MKLDTGVVLGIVGLLVVVIGGVASALVYGRSEFRRNVLDLQQKAEDSQATINEALQTELALRDREIERLQATKNLQAEQIKALQEVVSQGTQVAALVGGVEVLRRDVLDAIGSLPERIAQLTHPGGTK